MQRGALKRRARPAYSLLIRYDRLRYCIGALIVRVLCRRALRIGCGPVAANSTTKAPIVGRRAGFTGDCERSEREANKPTHWAAQRGSQSSEPCLDEAIIVGRRPV